jgi:hypothetical protein
LAKRKTLAPHHCSNSEPSSPQPSLRRLRVKGRTYIASSLFTPSNSTCNCIFTGTGADRYKYAIDRTWGLWFLAKNLSVLRSVSHPRRRTLPQSNGNYHATYSFATILGCTNLPLQLTLFLSKTPDLLNRPKKSSCNILVSQYDHISQEHRLCNNLIYRFYMNKNKIWSITYQSILSKEKVAIQRSFLCYLLGTQ